MSEAIQFQSMSKFSGVNNVDGATRLSPDIVGHEYAFPLQQANNVQIDNTYGLSSRSGYDDILSGSDIHSLWSDGVTCLYADGTTFKQLNTDYTVITLRSSMARARVSYAPFNDRIYYTNGYQIGYVKSLSSNLLVDPLLEFKLPLPAGQLIEYYRGCLYVAYESILYISDPLCDYFDVRYGYKQFNSKITLLRAVDDGLYIGDNKIWWVNGKAADEFERIESYSHYAIPFTDIRVNGQHTGESVKGNVAFWTCDNGICLGDNAGTVTNLTESRYTFTSTPNGAGFIRENANIRHYINSLF